MQDQLDRAALGLDVEDVMSASGNLAQRCGEGDVRCGEIFKQEELAAKRS